MNENPVAPTPSSPPALPDVENPSEHLAQSSARVDEVSKNQDSGQDATSTTHSDEFEPGDDPSEWIEEEIEVAAEDAPGTVETERPTVRVRRRRVVRTDAVELRLRGRRAMCAAIPDLAPKMLKTVKLRVLGRYLPSTRGLEDDDLTNTIKVHAPKIADRARILAAVRTPDADSDRGHLKAIIFTILLQEETHSLDENRLDAKVIDFEKELVKRSKSLDLSELKRNDPERWHHFDTYRIVLEAAWSNDGVISPDETRLTRPPEHHPRGTLANQCVAQAVSQGQVRPAHAR